MYLISLILFILVGCSHTVQKKEVVEQRVVNVDVATVKIPAGEVKFVELMLPGVKELGALICNQQKVFYLMRPDKISFYLAASYFLAGKQESCYLEIAGKKHLVVKAEILVKNYPSETLHVDKKRVVLNAKDLKRALAEKAVLNKIYAQSSLTPYFNRPFIAPLQSKLTSLYGSKRLYNDHKQSQHLGLDFRASVGTPIKVANRGRVVLTKDLFFTGNTVIVDHGLGIYTLYAHLSKILVKQGDIIEQGDIVGLAGATGRVTGPHLHWGVKLQNSWINGFSLIAASKQMFE